MKDLNCFTCTGRLTRDSELKHTTSGIAVCTFSIAINTSKKTDSGYEDKPNYIDLQIWRERAVKLSELLLKGVQVSLSAELDQQSWEDKEGHRITKIIFNVNDIIITNKKESQQKDSAVSAEPEKSNPLSDDDLPF